MTTQHTPTATIIVDARGELRKQNRALAARVAELEVALRYLIAKVEDGDDTGAALVMAREAADK